MPRPIEETSPTFMLAGASILPSIIIEDIRAANKATSCDPKVRLLHVLQLVVTVIALPLILLSTALEFAFRVAICQFSEAVEILSIPLFGFAMHAWAFPSSLVGVFTNDDLAHRLFEAIGNCTK